MATRKTTNHEHAKDAPEKRKTELQRLNTTKPRGSEELKPINIVEPPAGTVTREMFYVHAAYTNNIDVTRTCLHIWKVPPDAVSDGYTALVHACFQGHTELAKYLIE